MGLSLQWRLHMLAASIKISMLKANSRMQPAPRCQIGRPDPLIRGSRTPKFTNQPLKWCKTILVDTQKIRMSRMITKELALTILVVQWTSAFKGLIIRVIITTQSSKLAAPNSRRIQMLQNPIQRQGIVCQQWEA